MPIATVSNCGDLPVLSFFASLRALLAGDHFFDNPCSNRFVHSCFCQLSHFMAALRSRSQNHSSSELPQNICQVVKITIWDQVTCFAE